MLKDAKVGRITGLHTRRVMAEGAPIREIMDAFIKVQVETMGEAQPRKEELHMDKVKPSSLLRRFKAMARYLDEHPSLYTNEDGVGTYHFTDDYFRKRWAHRLKHGLPR
jgi:hypothetical protein